MTYRWQQIAESCFELVSRSVSPAAPSELWDAILEGIIRVDRDWTEEEIATFRRCDPEDQRELSRLLDDKRGRHVVKWLIFKAGVVPEPLLVPTLRAGVRIIDPSWNKQFIWPCLASHGRRRVLEILLDIAEHGSDFDKAGVVKAWYWTDMDRRTYRGLYGADLFIRDADDPVDDLLDRWAAWVVSEFIRNPDMDVRRSLVHWLPGAREAHPEAWQRAMNIAAALPDAYIRQRLAVQAGLSDSYPPLPRRAAGPDGKDDSSGHW